MQRLCAPAGRYRRVSWAPSGNAPDVRLPPARFSNPSRAGESAQVEVDLLSATAEPKRAYETESEFNPRNPSWDARVKLHTPPRSLPNGPGLGMGQPHTILSGGTRILRDSEGAEVFWLGKRRRQLSQIERTVPLVITYLTTRPIQCL